MVDELKLFEALAKMRDNLYGAATALDELIQQTSKTVLRSYDVSKIAWTQKQGDKGPYEIATSKQDTGFTEYAALLAHLKERDGKISKDGFFYWLFQDSETIGRKPQKKV